MTDRIAELRGYYRSVEFGCTPVIPKPSFLATFRPEAWIKDEAVEVDAEGPTEWDCTDAVDNDPSYFIDIMDIAYGVDRMDCLHDDPAAPQWVREWDGPFTITVSEKE